MIELARQPGLRRRQQRRPRPRPVTTSRCCSTPTASCSTARSPHSPRSRARIRGALHAPRLLNADGSVQRSVAPAARDTPGALLPALVHPPLLPRALRERAEPHRGGRGTHRRLGDRRLPGRRHRHAAAARARSTRPCTCSPRTWSSALRARAAGIPTVLHPRAADSGTRAGTRRSARASRSTCSPAAGARRSRGTLGARALALDDLGQALTFATRTAGHAALGGDARRPRAQLAALRRARRQCGQPHRRSRGPP